MMSLLDVIVLCTLILAGEMVQRCLSKDHEEMKHCTLHSMLGRQMGTCGNRLERTIENLCDAKARGLPHDLIYELSSATAQKRKYKDRSWKMPVKSALDFLRQPESKRQGKIAEYDDGDLQISLWDAGNQTLMMMDLIHDMPYQYHTPSLESGIYCECCVHHCTVNEMLEYCP